MRGDVGTLGDDEDEVHEIPRVPGVPEDADLVDGGHDGLEGEAPPLREGAHAPCVGESRRRQGVHGEFRGDVVGVNVFAARDALEPQRGDEGALAAAVRAPHDRQRGHVRTLASPPFRREGFRGSPSPGCIPFLPQAIARLLDVPVWSGPSREAADWATSAIGRIRGSAPCRTEAAYPPPGRNSSPFAPGAQPTGRSGACRGLPPVRAPRHVPSLPPWGLTGRIPPGAGEGGSRRGRPSRDVDPRFPAIETRIAERGEFPEEALDITIRPEYPASRLMSRRPPRPRIRTSGAPKRRTARLHRCRTKDNVASVHRRRTGFAKTGRPAGSRRRRGVRPLPPAARPGPSQETRERRASRPVEVAKNSATQLLRGHRS